MANQKVGRLEKKCAQAIIKTTDEIIEGQHPDQFLWVVWQTGSGTQTNMNFNEVIARRASEISDLKVHPNDHVNHGQSTNDSFPTAMHIATVLAFEEALIPALSKMESTLKSHAKKFREVIKIGRTHLQDATPLTVGQEFSAFAKQITLGIERIKATFPRLLSLAQGGTAVGTGINVHPQFSKELR